LAAAAGLAPGAALADDRAPAGERVAAAAMAPAGALAPGAEPSAAAGPLGAGPAARPERDAPDEDAREDKKYEGLLGPVRPGLMLAGAPLPQGLFGFELGVKYKRWVGGGIQYSTMPSIDVAQTSAGLGTLSINGRFHPFRGGFFVGAALGHTSVWAEATEQGQVARVEAGRTFLTPGLGWLYTLPSGLTFGFLNLGVNLPLSSSFETKLPPAVGLLQPDLGQRASDVARPLGRLVLPSLELLRVGYLL
jgi:hypothetical protein